MRKYVKPRAKFHELKGEVLLDGSNQVKGAVTPTYEVGNDYSKDADGNSLWN